MHMCALGFIKFIVLFEDSLVRGCSKDGPPKPDLP